MVDIERIPDGETLGEHVGEIWKLTVPLSEPVSATWASAVIRKIHDDLGKVEVPSYQQAHVDTGETAITVTVMDEDHVQDVLEYVDELIARGNLRPDRRRHTCTTGQSFSHQWRDAVPRR